MNDVIVKVETSGAVSTFRKDDKAISDLLCITLSTGESFHLGHGFFAYVVPQNIACLDKNPEGMHPTSVNWTLTNILKTGYEIHGDAFVMQLDGKPTGFSQEEANVIVDTLVSVYNNTPPSERYAEKGGKFKLVYVDMTGPGSGVAYFAKKLFSPSNFIGWDETPAKVYMTPPSTKLAPLVVPFLFSGYEISSNLVDGGMTVDDVNRQKESWLQTSMSVEAVFAQCSPDSFVEHIRATGGSAYAEIKPGQKLETT